MKIVKSSLKQTSFTCPSEWIGVLDDGREFVLHFRTGRLELRLGKRAEVRGERDKFDISSYMELDEALAIMAAQGVECS